jgi:hypothetical protein
MAMHRLAMLAALTRLVKDARAYEGSVVLETLARSRADELRRKRSTERSERAAAYAELEALRAIETMWQALEPEMPRLRQVQVDAAVCQGRAILWEHGKHDAQGRARVVGCCVLR